MTVEGSVGKTLYTVEFFRTPFNIFGSPLLEMNLECFVYASPK